jgi:hypothetical protein
MKNAAWPAMSLVLAGATSRLPQSYQSLQLSSQRARAALGRRGPLTVLAANAAAARQCEIKVNELPIRAILPPQSPEKAHFTAVSRRLVPAKGTEG